MHAVSRNASLARCICPAQTGGWARWATTEVHGHLDMIRIGSAWCELLYTVITPLGNILLFTWAIRKRTFSICAFPTRADKSVYTVYSSIAIQHPSPTTLRAAFASINTSRSPGSCFRHA